MITTDGLAVPVLGTGAGMGSGAGLGVGGGVLGGLLAGGLAGALLGGGRGWGGWGGNGSPAASAVATDVVLNPAFQSLQNQINSVENTLNAHNIDQGITSVNQNISGTSRDQLNSIANLATAQATSAFTTLQSINALGRDIQTEQNQNALQQLNSFNNLTTTTLQGFNGAAMQVQNSTNQIIAQGTANAAAMAECCCEIKSTILADGNATRALINDLNVQNLRDQLSAANNKVSNNEQNQYLLSTILTHLHPVEGSRVV